SQVAKATVCKTVIPRFKSGCRLHFLHAWRLYPLHRRRPSYTKMRSSPMARTRGPDTVLSMGRAMASTPCSPWHAGTVRLARADPTPFVERRTVRVDPAARPGPGRWKGGHSNECPPIFYSSPTARIPGGVGE